MNGFQAKTARSTRLQAKRQANSSSPSSAPAARTFRTSAPFLTAKTTSAPQSNNLQQVLRSYIRIQTVGIYAGCFFCALSEPHFSPILEYRDFFVKELFIVH